MCRAATKTAPAASMRSIKVASRADGLRSRLIFDPARVGRPCTSNRFFTANGTPARGGAFLPPRPDPAPAPRRVGAPAPSCYVEKKLRDGLVLGNPRQRGFGC